MFIDGYGREYKTKEEAEQYYADDFKNTVLNDSEELADYIVIDVIDILDWILRDHSELFPKFYEKFSFELKNAEREYINEGLCTLEEV